MEVLSFNWHLEKGRYPAMQCYLSELILLTL